MVTNCKTSEHIDTILPKIVVTSSGNMMCEFVYGPFHRDAQMATSVTMNLLDCNAPWIPIRWDREHYMDILAAKVRSICKEIPEWKNSFVIDGWLVDQVIAKIESMYKMKLYQERGEDVTVESKFRPENTPRCPSCGSYLKLRWVPWDNNPFKMALVHRCIYYKEKGCKERMDALWKGRCPPLVASGGVFFHNWQLEGYPIPRTSMVQPLTIWSLSSIGSEDLHNNEHFGGSLMSKKKVLKEIKRGRGHKIMTEEMEVMLKDTYSEYGPTAVLLNFPDCGLSWNQICMRAGKMGLKQRPKSPGKKIRKYMTSHEG